MVHQEIEEEDESIDEGEEDETVFTYLPEDIDEDVLNSDISDSDEKENSGDDR